MTPTWSKNGVDLYLGDCRKVIAHVKADCVVTDPPYGVMLGEVDNSKARNKDQQPYTLFSDTPEYIRRVCVPVIESCRELFGRVVLTPGTRNLREYPAWDSIGCWFNPAGTGLGKWGFICSHPILYYGLDPRRGKCPTPDSCTGNFDRESTDGHPCPKPVAFTRWLVNKASIDGETVLDPFMGSGTTGVACVRLGRKFLGVEIEPKYFEIAVRRIESAMDETALLDYAAKQEQMITEVLK